ncbi:hypothetical protein ACMV5L_01595 [Serratia plymuthica]|uniref:hypothetical protein n=1 Tax=Serratia plymuthica TaxID=82996 RepID=UPI003DA5C3D5
MNAIDIFAKIILPIMTLILAAIGHKAKWGIKTDSVFERYSKLSKFTFELATQLKDDRLKEISGEYGYAAITRKEGLSRDERYTLLNMLNPVEGIEEYHKCSDYLRINVVHSGFSWKKKRYNSPRYRRTVSLINSIIYFIGAIMLFCPVFYQPLQDTVLGEIFRELSTNKKIGLTIYIMLTGLFFFAISLNRMSKLHQAGKLIKNSHSLR